MPNTSPGLISLESVRQKLLASLHETWQGDVEQQLSQEHQGFESFNDEQKFKLFLEYVLHTDIRHYWKSGTEGEQPWFVQVEQVQDISQPVKRRYSHGGELSARGTRRMLRMVLFDGKNHHIGIEHASLAFPWPRMGSKLVIDDGVLKKNGILMLTPSTCGFLGGFVKEFEEHQQMVDSLMQEPLYGRRGPPLKLDEYMKMLKEKIQDSVNMSTRNQEIVENVIEVEEANTEVVAPPAETYVIPSDSDDDWDIDALLETKRDRNEIGEPDTNVSTLRELKRRKELRAQQQNNVT